MCYVISFTGTLVLVFLLSSILLLFISQPLAYSFWNPRFLLWLEHRVIWVLITGWFFPFWTRRMYISWDSAFLFSCYSLFFCIFVIFTCFNQLTLEKGQKEKYRSKHVLLCLRFIQYISISLFEKVLQFSCVTLFFSNCII